MALTFPRWVAAFLIGALLLVPLAFREVYTRLVEPMTPAVEANGRLAEASGRAASMADHVRLFQLRDSIMKSPLVTRPVAPGVAVAMDRALDAHLVQDLEALVVHSRELAVPRVVKTPVVVAFVLDTVQFVRGVRRNGYHHYDGVAVDYILPAAPGAPCTVLARVSLRILASSPKSLSFEERFDPDQMYERFLGPCALFSAFGAPGIYINQWLDGGGWSLAAVNNWEMQSAPAYQPPTELRGPNDPQREASFDLSLERGFSGFAGNATRNRLNFTGLECLAAKANACMEGLKHANPFAFTLHMYAPRFLELEDEYVRYRNGILPFGNYGRDLVSDFIYRNGQEKFGRVWRSDLPLADAFRVEAGVDIEQATRDWAQHTYGVQQLGPVMNTAGVVGGGISILLGLLVTFRAARRRQVT